MEVRKSDVCLHKRQGGIHHGGWTHNYPRRSRNLTPTLCWGMKVQEAWLLLYRDMKVKPNHCLAPRYRGWEAWPLLSPKMGRSRNQTLAFAWGVEVEKPNLVRPNCIPQWYEGQDKWYGVHYQPIFIRHVIVTWYPRWKERTEATLHLSSYIDKGLRQAVTCRMKRLLEMVRDCLPIEYFIEAIRLTHMVLAIDHLSIYGLLMSKITHTF